MQSSLGRVSKEDMDLERNVCYIDGEEYPLFYAKVLNIICDEEQPVLYFLGKPGSGKSYAAAKQGHQGSAYVALCADRRFKQLCF